MATQNLKTKNILIFFDQAKKSQKSLKSGIVYFFVNYFSFLRFEMAPDNAKIVKSTGIRHWIRPYPKLACSGYELYIVCKCIINIFHLYFFLNAHFVNSPIDLAIFILENGYLIIIPLYIRCYTTLFNYFGIMIH